MSEVFEKLAKEETDEHIRKLAENKKVAMLAIIAPYVPYRVSPHRIIYAELETPEEFGVESFILRAKKLNVKKLYMLLHSRGGGVSSAYVITKALRKYFNEIKVFIPQLAASGATLIAIAANEIVMGEISRLSPIDVYVWGEEGGRSALALIRSFMKFNEIFERTPPEDIPYPYKSLIESIDPEELERMSGILKEVESYALTLLKMANYPEEKAKEIAEKLVYGFHSHYEVIDYTRAKELGLHVTWYEKYEDEWNLMRYWLGKYILRESPIHHILYTLPEAKKHEKQNTQ